MANTDARVSIVIAWKNCVVHRRPNRWYKRVYCSDSSMTDSYPQWQLALGTFVVSAQYFIGDLPASNVHVCCLISPEE